MVQCACMIHTSCAVFIRVVGGESGAMSSLAPKLGPLGLVSAYSLARLAFISHCFNSIRNGTQILTCNIYSPQRRLVMILPREHKHGRE